MRARKFESEVRRRCAARIVNPTWGMRSRGVVPAKKVAVTVVTLVVLLLLAGCGSANGTKDPFVGTWNGGPDYPDYWVISKAAGSYSVTGFVTTFPHAERQGNKLTCWVDQMVRGEARIKMGFTSTGPDKLMLTDAYGPGVHIPLQRVSGSTVTPSPFYGHESPSAGP